MDECKPAQLINVRLLVSLPPQWYCRASHSAGSTPARDSERTVNTNSFPLTAESIDSKSAPRNLSRLQRKRKLAAAEWHAASVSSVLGRIAASMRVVDRLPRRQCAARLHTVRCTLYASWIANAPLSLPGDSRRSCCDAGKLHGVMVLARLIRLNISALRRRGSERGRHLSREPIKMSRGQRANTDCNRWMAGRWDGPTAGQAPPASTTWLYHVVSVSCATQAVRGSAPSKEKESGD